MEILLPGGEDAPIIGQNLRLSVLGPFSARFGGHELTLTTRKAKALLGYLALSNGAQDTRERLVALLWSESDEERARASLRQAVHEIKMAGGSLGWRGFNAEKQTLAITDVALSTDIDDILASASTGSVHPRLLATQRIVDALFEDIGIIDPAFHAWVSAKRQLLNDRLILALEGLLSPEHEIADASSVAQALLNLDPTHEFACRHLIRARARKGDIGGAMKVYKTLWDLLDAEYDVEPSQETQDLIVEIRQTPPAQLSIPAKPQASKKLLISLGPFDAEGIPGEKRHLVNGFCHELVACLARFREWSVRTVGSVFVI